METASKYSINYKDPKVKNELGNLISGSIYYQFNQFKFHHLLATGELANKIHDLFISFSYNENQNFSARAFTDRDEIEFNLEALIEAKHLYLIAHEVTHFITKWHFHDPSHTLEFAIILYCIENKFDSSKKYFFKSYDIHEDKAFPFLSINACLFDNFIRAIEWKTLEELADKAKFLADKIRAKQAFFSVAEWNKDYEKSKLTTGETTI